MSHMGLEAGIVSALLVASARARPWAVSVWVCVWGDSTQFGMRLDRFTLHCVRRELLKPMGPS